MAFRDVGGETCTCDRCGAEQFGGRDQWPVIDYAVTCPDCEKKLDKDEPYTGDDWQETDEYDEG